MWPQTLAVPPPPQLSGAVQTPQSMTPPQPSPMGPQCGARRRAAARDAGRLAADVGLPPPPQVSGAGAGAAVERAAAAVADRARSSRPARRRSSACRTGGRTGWRCRRRRRSRGAVQVPHWRMPPQPSPMRAAVRARAGAGAGRRRLPRRRRPACRRRRRSGPRGAGAAVERAAAAVADGPQSVPGAAQVRRRAGAGGRRRWGCRRRRRSGRRAAAALEDAAAAVARRAAADARFGAGQRRARGRAAALSSHTRGMSKSMNSSAFSCGVSRVVVQPVGEGAVRRVARGDVDVAEDDAAALLSAARADRRVEREVLRPTGAFVSRSFSRCEIHGVAIAFDASMVCWAASIVEVCPSVVEAPTLTSHSASASPLGKRLCRS